MLFNKITVIGIGLIGSSLARVIKREGLAQRLTVCDQNPLYLQQAMELEIADEALSDPVAAVKDADLVVLATPVGVYGNLTRQISPFLNSGTIITDVGSVKKYACEEIEKNLNGREDLIIVPGHPVAGTEKSGPRAGFAELFALRWCILTPGRFSTPEAIEKITLMWEAAGMNVDTMSVEHHDKVMAAVSHLPHLIAFSIVGTIADLEGYEKQEIIKYSASGFRDFTRIAGSDPTMWRDILINNKTTILDLLQRFVEDLIALERNIRWNEGQKLFDLFSRTRKIRTEVIEARQDKPETEKLMLLKEDIKLDNGK